MTDDVCNVDETSAADSTLSEQSATSSSKFILDDIVATEKAEMAPPQAPTSAVESATPKKVVDTKTIEATTSQEEQSSKPQQTPEVVPQTDMTEETKTKATTSVANPTSQPNSILVTVNPKQESDSKEEVSPQTTVTPGPVASAPLTNAESQGDSSGETSPAKTMPEAVAATTVPTPIQPNYILVDPDESSDESESDSDDELEEERKKRRAKSAARKFPSSFPKPPSRSRKDVKLCGIDAYTTSSLIQRIYSLGASTVAEPPKKMGKPKIDDDEHLASFPSGHKSDKQPNNVCGIDTEAGVGFLNRLLEVGAATFSDPSRNCHRVYESNCGKACNPDSVFNDFSTSHEKRVVSLVKDLNEVAPDLVHRDNLVQVVKSTRHKNQEWRKSKQQKSKFEKPKPRVETVDESDLNDDSSEEYPSDLDEFLDFARQVVEEQNLSYDTDSYRDFESLLELSVRNHFFDEDDDDSMASISTYSGYDADSVSRNKHFEENSLISDSSVLRMQGKIARQKPDSSNKENIPPEQSMALSHNNKSLRSRDASTIFEEKASLFTSGEDYTDMESVASGHTMKEAMAEAQSWFVSMKESAGNPTIQGLGTAQDLFDAIHEVAVKMEELSKPPPSTFDASEKKPNMETKKAVARSNGRNMDDEVSKGTSILNLSDMAPAPEFFKAFPETATIPEDEIISQMSMSGFTSVRSQRRIPSKINTKKKGPKAKTQVNFQPQEPVFSGATTTQAQEKTGSDSDDTVQTGASWSAIKRQVRAGNTAVLQKYMIDPDDNSVVSLTPYEPAPRTRRRRSRKKRIQIITEDEPFDHEVAQSVEQTVDDLAYILSSKDHSRMEESADDLDSNAVLSQLRNVAPNLYKAVLARIQTNYSPNNSNAEPSPVASPEPKEYSRKTRITSRVGDVSSPIAPSSFEVPTTTPDKVYWADKSRDNGTDSDEPLSDPLDDQKSFEDLSTIVPGDQSIHTLVVGSSVASLPTHLSEDADPYRGDSFSATLNVPEAQPSRNKFPPIPEDKSNSQNDASQLDALLAAFMSPKTAQMKKAKQQRRAVVQQKEAVLSQVTKEIPVVGGSAVNQSHGRAVIERLQRKRKALILARQKQQQQYRQSRSTTKANIQGRSSSRVNAEERQDSETVASPTSVDELKTMSARASETDSDTPSGSSSQSSSVAAARSTILRVRARRQKILKNQMLSARANGGSNGKALQESVDFEQDSEETLQAGSKVQKPSPPAKQVIKLFWKKKQAAKKQESNAYEALQEPDSSFDGSPDMKSNDILLAFSPPSPESPISEYRLDEESPDHPVQSAHPRERPFPESNRRLTFSDSDEAGAQLRVHTDHRFVVDQSLQLAKGVAANEEDGFVNIQKKKSPTSIADFFSDYDSQSKPKHKNHLGFVDDQEQDVVFVDEDEGIHLADGNETSDEVRDGYVEANFLSSNKFEI